MLLANPFDAPTTVTAEVTQTHRLHRVYVDHHWRRVPKHGAQPIQVFDEALAGFPEVDGGDMDDLRKELAIDNRVSVQGWAQRPFPADCGAPTLTGGVSIIVGSGRATEIEITRATFTLASGVVRFSDGSGSPGDGTGAARRLRNGRHRGDRPVRRRDHSLGGRA